MYHIGPHEFDIIIYMNEHVPIKSFKKSGITTSLILFDQDN